MRPPAALAGGGFRGVRNAAGTRFPGPDANHKDANQIPMKLTIERAALLKALGHVQSVVERRNTIPILANVLIEAAKDKVSLTATDMDIAIVESVPGEVARGGTTTVQAHTLYDIVRKL